MKKRIVILLSIFMINLSYAQKLGITNNEESPYIKLKSINIGDCQWTSGFWADKFKLCEEVMAAIQSPQDRLKEEVEETVEEISRTLKALFPAQPRSPKERLFNKQIQELLQQSQKALRSDRPIEAINFSRKAQEILKKLEQETIKGDIPKLIIELRASIDDLLNRCRRIGMFSGMVFLKGVSEAANCGLCQS